MPVAYNDQQVDTCGWCDLPLSNPFFGGGWNLMHIHGKFQGAWSLGWCHIMTLSSMRPFWTTFEILRLVGDPATRFFSCKFSWKSLRRSWSLLELLGSLSSQQRLKGWTGHVRYGVRLVKKGLALGLWSLHTWMSGWCRETQPSISAIYHMCIMFLIESIFGNIHIYIEI